MSLLLLLLSSLAALAGTLTIDVLDVGQGDGIVLRSPAGKVVLIDAGEEREDVARQLSALGVDKIALAVATHAHADHIGGMAAVLARFPVGLYIDNGLPHTTATYEGVMDQVEQRGIPYKPAREGQVYTLDDGIRIEVLNPPATPIRGTRSDLNANSVVLRVTHGEDCLLFTGDSEADTERRLIAAGIGPCEVLKVAHHGSGHSSTAAWLSAVKPEIALISAGVDNSYGHPDPEALSRLKAAGARIYRTDLQQGLRLESTGSGVKVSTGVKLAAAPVAAAAASEPDTAADTGCAYLASDTSEVFHEHSCGTGARIAAEKRTCYMTREQAVAAGKRPAACCDP